jgi:predicted nucleic acid-binding protein
VYAFDQNEPEKSVIAKQLISEFGTDGNLVVSTQVLQQFYVVVTKVGKSMLTLEQAENIENDFAKFPLIQVDRLMISLAMKRHQSKIFSFWDSLIVEAALKAGCVQLLSEDMQDGLSINSMTIRNPFSCLITK